VPLASNTVTASILKTTSLPATLEPVDSTFKKPNDKKAAAVCK
jgi:hypothetical protein